MSRTFVACRYWLCFSLSVAVTLLLPLGGRALPASPDKADSEAAKHLVALFEARYRPAHTLQVTFLEKYLEDGRVTRSEAGVAYFRKPGKMRWEYDAPESDLFLVDGKSAWFYVPADHTVTRVPAKQSADWRTPLALLAGEAKVSRVCAKVELAASQPPEDPGDAVLHCHLRGPGSSNPDASSPEASAQQSASSTKGGHASAKDAAGETAYFEIQRSTGELVRVLIQQAGGVAVEFHFENWRFNPPLSDALFRFDAPPGVAIVNGELSSAGPL